MGRRLTGALITTRCETRNRLAVYKPNLTGCLQKTRKQSPTHDRYSDVKQKKSSDTNTKPMDSLN